MRRHMIQALVTAVVLSVGFAGVAAASRPSLSKKDYLKQADNVCRQANELRDEVAQSVFADLQEGQEPTSDQLGQYVANIEPINDQEIDSLRALPAPSGDKKKLKKIYKLVEKAFDKVSDDPDVLLTGPDPFAKANKAAQKYGFEICGAESTD